MVKVKWLKVVKGSNLILQKTSYWLEDKDRQIHGNTSNLFFNSWQEYLNLEYDGLFNLQNFQIKIQHLSEGISLL